MAAAAGGATGCYKCGRPGHWSRDCPSQPTPEQPTPAAAPPASQQTQRFGNKRKEPWVERLKPAKAQALPRRMPKLTPDLLLGADGLGYVLEKIPRQVSIRRRGHEVEDLKSLLEAYVMWHQTLLPYFSYSQFVEKVEKVGSSKRVRGREIRDGRRITTVMQRRRVTRLRMWWRRICVRQLLCLQLLLHLPRSSLHL